MDLDHEPLITTPNLMEITRLSLTPRANALCTKVDLRTIVVIVCIDEYGPALNECLRDFLGLNTDNKTYICPDYIIRQQRYISEQELFGAFEGVYYGDGYRIYIESVSGVRR